MSKLIYVIGAISLASLVLNFLIYRHVSRYLAIEPVELTIERIWDEPLPEAQQAVEPESTNVETPITTTMVKDVYQGWVNKTDIPMGPSRPAPPPIKREQPSPLARPEGFV